MRFSPINMIAAPRRRATGFSLIEVIIVATILAILAGIGLISVQQVMDNARRKATIAEARELATALSFAHQETGIFPKFNYLVERLQSFSADYEAGLLDRDSANNQRVYNGVDYIGNAIWDNADFDTYERRIMRKWDGPYWAVGVTSKSRYEQAGGFVMMDIYRSHDASDNFDRGTPTAVRWPTDQWGRPYVLYLLEQAQGASDTHQNVRFLQSPRGEPDFACAVVSYGEDGYPGLLRYLPLELDRKIEQRLWTELVPRQHYQTLQPSGYVVTSDPQGSARKRIEAYAESKFAADSANYTWNGEPLIGVTDSIVIDGRLTSSDDIVIEF